LETILTVRLLQFRTRADALLLVYGYEHERGYWAASSHLVDPAVAATLHPIAELHASTPHRWTTTLSRTAAGNMQWRASTARLTVPHVMRPVDRVVFDNLDEVVQ
jgi:hypothetical protein